MTPADETLDTIRKLVDRITLGLPELTRRARISSRRDGYPARASGSQPATPPPYDPDRQAWLGGIPIDYADPTGSAACQTYRPDPVTRRNTLAHRHLDHALRALQIVEAQLHDPKDFDENLPWCAPCATIKHDDGRPYLTPPVTTIRGATTVGGRLKDPIILCSWHYDYVRTVGCLPSKGMTAEYVTKGRAPRRSA